MFVDFLVAGYLIKFHFSSMYIILPVMITPRTQRAHPTTMVRTIWTLAFPRFLRSCADLLWALEGGFSVGGMLNDGMTPLMELVNKHWWRLVHAGTFWGDLLVPRVHYVFFEIWTSVVYVFLFFGSGENKYIVCLKVLYNKSIPTDIWCIHDIHGVCVCVCVP